MRTIEEHLKERIIKAMDVLAPSSIDKEEIEKFIKDSSYEESFLKEIQPVDMFPQTKLLQK